MQETHKKRFKKLDNLAWLLDSSIRIPGTGWRIGLDGLIGLVPGIGDLIASGLSGYIVLQAIRMGVAPSVILRMMLNILLESIIGVIPLFGDIFDFVFRANRRNVALMQNYLDDPRTTTQTSTINVILSIGLVIAVLVFIVWLAISLLGWIIQAIT